MLRRKHREGANGIFPATIIDVIPGRPVAALTPGILQRFFARRDALEMWVLVESIPDRRMTRFAHVVTHVAICWRLSDARTPKEYGEEKLKTNHLTH